ncbi:MAG: CBS domain-containing protein [Deltaproteobacteria bacterium]|jgi:acetoin utilization protein AcuB|nr:CBS domain-containing protein [Deltaproteobacteria bacterium]
MLVKNWMSKNVITIDADDTMQDAMKLLKEHDIRMLPVMKKSMLVGIVTDRDLKQASASDATTLEIHELLYLLTKIKVRDIMTKNPITVPPDYTAEETAQVLLESKISGAPVVDAGGQIVGTITQTDLFRVLIALTGIKNGGIQFGFQIEDRPGSIKEVEDIIREYGGRIVSILTSYDNVPMGYRKVYIRMQSIEQPLLEILKSKLIEIAAFLYMIDQREDSREIFLREDELERRVRDEKETAAETFSPR